MSYGKENINPTVRIQLRKNVEVSITGIPIDLTENECKKLIELIKVFTIKE